MRQRSESELRQLAGGEPVSSGLTEFIESRSDAYPRSEKKVAELRDKIDELNKLLATNPYSVVEMITKHPYLSATPLLADLAEKLFLADLSITTSIMSLQDSFQLAKSKSQGSLYDFAEQYLNLDPKTRSKLLKALEPLFTGDLKDWIDCIYGIKDLQRILSVMASQERQKELLETVFTNSKLVVKLVDCNEYTGECGLLVRGGKPSMEELGKCTESQYVITPTTIFYYYKILHELKEISLNAQTLQALQTSFSSDQGILSSKQLQTIYNVTKHIRPEYKTPLAEINEIGTLFPEYKDCIAKLYLEGIVQSISSFKELEACLRTKPTYAKILLDGLLTDTDRVKEIMESEDDPEETAEKIKIAYYNPQDPEPLYHKKFIELYETISSSSPRP